MIPEKALWGYGILNFLKQLIKVFENRHQKDENPSDDIDPLQNESSSIPLLREHTQYHCGLSKSDKKVYQNSRPNSS